MSDPTITNNYATLSVKWVDGNENKTRDVKFDGNYNFVINDKQYTVQDGQIKDSNGNIINVLELSKNEAHQFIGMSNAEGSRESDYKKDYTFTPGDIEYAKQLGTKTLQMLFGHGIGISGSQECNTTDRKFETTISDIKYRWILPNKKVTSTVSIWQINEK